MDGRADENDAAKEEQRERGGECRELDRGLEKTFNLEQIGFPRANLSKAFSKKYEGFTSLSLVLLLTTTKLRNPDNPHGRAEIRVGRASSAKGESF